MGANQGRRPRGTGGTDPQNLRWGTAHALVPPIFRQVVLSGARERMNRVKKSGLIKEFFSEIVVFVVKKGSYIRHFIRVKNPKSETTGR